MSAQDTAVRTLLLRDDQGNPHAILEPLSGEVTGLDADTGALAIAYDELANLASLIREAHAAISDELLARLDRRGKWTAEVDGFKIEAPSPTAGTVDYDPQALREGLLELVGQGHLDVEAVDAAAEYVEPEPPAPFYKRHLRGIAALEKLGPEVQAVLAAHRVEVKPPPRKVKIKKVAPR